jgi:hypothetical protein
MSEKLERYDAGVIEPQILTIRGQKVVLDTELARIYGVTTKVFNQAVKRNRRKFPTDFVFQLTMEEYEDLRSQIVTSSRTSNRSQIVTGSQKHRNPKYLPYAFTEHGAVMAANVLRSDRAIQMSVFVVRAFIRMRQLLVSQKDLARKLVDLEKKLTARLDIHETAITEVLRQIMLLLTPPSPEPEPPRRKIGFLVEDRRASYRPSKQSKVKTPVKNSSWESLAEKLIQNLENVPLDALDEAWIKEAEKRFSAWRRGQRKGVSAKRAFKQIRKDLNW